uniref:Uncharacterized protein n=1 Tax=viral metagenome TaxID=1070528 RepID=A0A6C0K4P4_9ZZZZ
MPANPSEYEFTVIPDKDLKKFEQSIEKYLKDIAAREKAKQNKPKAKHGGRRTHRKRPAKRTRRSRS